MSSTLQTWEYVAGRPHPNQQQYATYYTKPSSPGYTGGGYKLWRSNEERPHTPTQGKEDVYVAGHRLLAVSECYPSDMPISEILEDMKGKDVHHTTGFPSANFGDSPNFDEPGIEVIGHGEHSSITQVEMRAWGEDAKREVETPDVLRCVRCDDVLEEVKLTSDDWDGPACHDCAKVMNDDAAISVTGI